MVTIFSVRMKPLYVKLCHSILFEILFDYCLGGQPFERGNHIKDLVFLYVPSLDFQPHIDYIACEALCVLGFIRRHSSNFNFPKYLHVSACGIRAWHCLYDHHTPNGT